MSFQDVGRRRQHPIFDRHRMSTCKSSRVEASPKTTAPVKAMKENRGVRPRLSMTCPVTARNLVDDNMSVASASIVTQESKTDSLSEDETEGMPSVVRRPAAASKYKTMFAKLTSEIVNFQRMVADLEKVMEAAGSSPETQWRTRILMRSAQDADRDIWKKLNEFESSSPVDSSSRAKMAARKVRRDFGRVHEDLTRVLAVYERKQLAEVSFLTGSEEKKEEFFDRVMREREEEVNNINRSMNKVNEIYQDLAALVDGQQEQIDRIAEATEESKANTRSGLDHIQNGIFGLCGLDANDSIVDGKEDKTKSANAASSRARTHFETFQDDFVSMRTDVYKLGQSIMGDLQDSAQEQMLLVSGCTQTFGCNGIQSEFFERY